MILMAADIIQLRAPDIVLMQRMTRVFADVFEMQHFSPPPSEHLGRLLGNPDFIAFAACANGDVIGGITAYVLTQYYSTSRYVYVFDLAVLKDHQRQGIGSRLWQAVVDHSRTLGAEEVFVQADNEDAHAIEFYRATGGIPESVTHFNYPVM